MLNFTILCKDGSGKACTEPQPVATPVRNDKASKTEVDDTLVNDPKDEQSTKPSGTVPAVTENADPPKPDSQQNADEAADEPGVSTAMQDVKRKARPTGWFHSNMLSVLSVYSTCIVLMYQFNTGKNTLSTWLKHA